MNRPYGSPPFYPPRQYQSSPGPPQPQWQASPAPPSGPGWHDPRLPPVPPGANAGPTYNPNTYGPIPPTSYSPISPPQPNPPDTASWGVRYNQNQHYAKYQEPKPPLPPRPPSVGGYGPSTGDQTQTAGSWSQAQSTTTYAQAPQWQHDTYNYQQAQQTPPPPPPRPPEYLALPQEPQGWPHPHYSHNPPSHHYEPSNQHLSQSAGPGGQYRHQAGSVSEPNPTVSPIESPVTYWRPPPPQTLAYAADNQGGNEVRKPTPKPTFGGPSDWEHFEPIGEHVENTSNLETPTPSTELDKQDPHRPPHPADASYVTTGQYVAQALQQSHSDEPLTEPRSPVSSAAASSPIPLPATPAPLSTGRTHQDPTDRSDSASRHGKESPSFNMTVPQRTGTIDGVIQAWNKPLEGQSSWHAENPISSRASSRQSSVSAFSTTKPQDDLAETTKPSPKHRQNSNPYLSTRVANPEPYGDLEPEYRASLSRYVIMLRKEAEASSETNKFNIFKAFMDKEMRLRSVLYGLDGGATETVKAANLDAVPLNPIAKVEEHGDEQPLSLKALAQEQKTGTRDAVGRTPTPNNTWRSESPKLAVSTSTAPNDISVVAVDQVYDDVEYSPGGRPRVPKLQALSKSSHPASSKTSPAASAPIITLSKGVASPSENAPIVLDDYSTGGPESPGRNAPIVLDMQDQSTTAGSTRPVSKETPASPLKFEPSRPVYTPFRYTDASREDLDKLTIQQPAHQAYAAMRQSADSGRILPQVSAAPGTPSVESQDKFLGLIRSQSRAHPSKRAETPSNLLVKDPRTETSLALRARVPTTLPDGSQHPKLAAICQDMEKIPDEFGFIRETVLRWDRQNRQVRERQDRERQSRQEESEKHIDGLYDDKEIGYADISTMELDFKLAEAKRKYEEDQLELDSFTAQVFEPVTERLRTEISKLNAQYILALNLLDLESESASQCMNDVGNRVRASQAMDVVISLFDKLQVRHQKLAEAHFERERRRKKLELTVLYANGDVAAVKKLEQEFLTAERLQVLHEAQERDMRANKLIDTFDRATARALGDNQAYVDDLCAKLRKMDAAIAREGKDLSQSNTFEPEGLRETLSHAKAALDFVAADSNAMLGASNTADMILNDADYAVSVAKAQMANAAGAAYATLKEEKQKEDTKIREDLETRRESIAKGPADASSIIEDILTKFGPDPEHQQRIQRALEAAKMRNANKDP